MTNTTTVTFHGTELIAIAGETPASTLVAMKPIVEGMGLDWPSQRKKLARHPVLYGGMVVMTIPSISGDQNTVLIALDMLNFWLATIHTDRIKNLETRKRIISYQAECARVLFDHFFGKHQPTSSVPLSETERLVGMAMIELRDELDKMRAEMDSKVRKVFGDIYAGLSARQQEYDYKQHHEYITSNDIVVREGLPRAGRQAISTRISHDIQRFLIERGLGNMVRISKETGRYMFHVDGVNRWRIDGGGMAMLSKFKSKPTALKVVG